MKLYRSEGNLCVEGKIVELGDSTWKVTRAGGALKLEVFDRHGQRKVEKLLKRPTLYKVQPKGVTTLVSNAVRGKKGFEPASRLAPVTA
jgi:hypothetical protein